MKVIYGDCLEEMKKMDDNCIDVIITDPPYGIDFQSSRKIDASKRLKKIDNDKRPYIWWLLEAHRVLKWNGAMLCFTRFDVEQDFRTAMRLAGFTGKAQVIWDKKIHGMGDLKGDFAPQHENIIFAVKGRYIFPNSRPKSVFTYQRVSPSSLLHPNEKPIELMMALCRAVARKGDIILDPFMGCGATGIGAKLEGCEFIGIEISKEYCDIAEARINNAVVDNKLL